MRVVAAVLRSAPVGIVLLLLLAAWALFSTPDAPEAAATAAGYLVLAAGLVIGVTTAHTALAVPGLLVLVGSGAAFLLTLPASLSGDPVAPPLDYMNANGALALCGAGGAVLATSGRSLGERAFAAVVALVTAALCLAQGAQAAAAAAVLLAGWSLARHLGRTSVLVVAGLLLAVVPASLPVLWGAGVLPQPPALVSLLSEERFDLWGEAVDIIGQHPVRGIGPGEFSQVSRTAADPDLAWAHSALLQTGAELGLVGVGLTALALAWAAAALGRRTVLLGILLLPTSVDYVLHFGGVLLALSVVVGGSVVGSSGRGNPWLTPPSP